MTKNVCHCVVLCCFVWILFLSFFPFSFWVASRSKVGHGSAALKKGKSSLLRLIRGEIMGPIPPQQRSVGWTRSPPHVPHALKSPPHPSNKVHRVQPGQRRHKKGRFSGSIGSDYFQSVCCFHCVNSTNQTMVRLRSRVQFPTNLTDCRQFVEWKSHFHVSAQRNPNSRIFVSFRYHFFAASTIYFPGHFFFPSGRL